MMGFTFAQIGSPLRLTLFDDRIEIKNLGILIPGLNIEEMFIGVSKLRNHVIVCDFREGCMRDQ